MNKDRSTLRMTRRNALKVGAAGLASLALPAIGRAKAAKITVACSGGILEEAYQKAYFRPFAAATGVAVENVPNPYAKLKAMVEANAVEWDVCQMAMSQAAVFARAGLLEPLDYGVINRSDLLAGVAYPYFMANNVGASVVSWNTRNVTAAQAPTRWADLWDLHRFPGKRAIWKRPSQTLELALLADGVPMNKLYPLDVERAIASLAKIRPSIYWWEQGAQITQLLINGEVAAGMCWNGRLHQPMLDGEPVKFIYNEAIFNSDAWLVPKGTKNKKEAMEFIAFTMLPQHQAEYSKVVPYGPVNKRALALLDKKLLDVLPSSEANFAKGVVQDVEWWGEYGLPVTERFNRWVLG